MVVFGFIRGRLLWCALGVVVFIWGRWVPSGTTWGSFGLFGVNGVCPGCRCVHWGNIRVRPGSRWVNLGSLGSFGCALVVVRLIRRSWVRSGALSGSSRSFWCDLGVVGFIRCG